MKYILERLTENLRVGQTPSVSAQMFLMFRVLLLRISPQHLTSLWPIMVTELVRNTPVLLSLQIVFVSLIVFKCFIRCFNCYCDWVQLEYLC